MTEEGSKEKDDLGHCFDSGAVKVSVQPNKRGTFTIFAMLKPLTR